MQTKTRKVFPEKFDPQEYVARLFSVSPQDITHLEVSGRIESTGLPFRVRPEDIQSIEAWPFPQPRW